MDPWNTLRSLLNFVAFAVIYQCVFRYWHYFSNKKVKCVRGLPLLGTFWRFLLGLDNCCTIAIQRCYNAFPSERFIGFYNPLGHPSYMIREPVLVNRIITEASDHFADRAFGAGCGSGVDGLLSESLAIWSKEEWRVKRTIARSGIDEEQMLQITSQCAGKMIENLAAIQREAHEVSEIFSKFSTEVMAAKCFGLLESETDNEFAMRIACLKELSGYKRWAYRCAPAFMNRLLGNPSNVNYFRQLVNNADEKVTHNLAGALKTSMNRSSDNQRSINGKTV